MVNFVHNLTAAVAAATSVRFLDFGKTRELDNTGRCGSAVPLNMYTIASTPGPVPGETWTLASPSANLYTIQSVPCGTNITWAGDLSGLSPIRFQGALTNRSSIIFKIVPTNSTQPEGPFNLVDSASGFALRAWPVSAYSPSSPITFETLNTTDTAQSFWIVSP